MKRETQDRNIPYKSQVELPVFYKGKPLGKNFIADAIVFDKIILEFKCIPRLTDTEEAQIINYLKASGHEVGLLINFGGKGKLEWKRFVFTHSKA